MVEENKSEKPDPEGVTVVKPATNEELERLRKETEREMAKSPEREKKASPP